MPPQLRSETRQCPQQDGAKTSEEVVLGCFPDICPDYLSETLSQHAGIAEQVISHILDQQDNGKAYPKRPRPSLKRKREPSEEGEEELLRKQFATGYNRHAGKPPHYQKSYLNAAKILLKSAFPQLYSQDVERAFKSNRDSIFSAYLELDKAITERSQNIRFKKVPTKAHNPESAFENSENEAEKEAVREFRVARTACEEEAAKREEEKRKQQEEVDNMERSKEAGEVADCECCYTDFPLNRMVHCNGETVHWFCRECARRMAESQIGLSKYHLNCMSMDGCDSTFDNSQRELFLDEKLTIALDKIEQEAVLRLAGIENLESCPFCSFAAECPPIEEDKEFRCLGPECGIVSCRHCRQETHIPKTCEEASKEHGLSARRVIEEAMSAALIRKCNKCNTPFIKENGCNKMTCTRNGCANVQCYVCSKSCDYSHFDDSSRGGKQGNCPLFDSVESRHEVEVQAAQEKARQQVAQENPAVEAELLEIKFSEKVQQDDKRRMAANPQIGRHAFRRAAVAMVNMPQRQAPRALEGMAERFGIPHDLLPPEIPAPAVRDLPGQQAQRQQGHANEHIPRAHANRADERRRAAEGYLAHNPNQDPAQLEEVLRGVLRLPARRTPNQRNQALGEQAAHPVNHRAAQAAHQVAAHRAILLAGQQAQQAHPAHFEALQAEFQRSQLQVEQQAAHQFALQIQQAQQQAQQAPNLPLELPPIVPGMPGPAMYPGYGYMHPLPGLPLPFRHADGTIMGAVHHPWASQGAGNVQFPPPNPNANHGNAPQQR
ncbi:hypothetical protein QBC35DRAFT_495365 [Podospora australis]|uniref:RING-type domain-containing protein n=1 Tax=Podospora australis TaxID=1536484 RepID=A0AAN7AKC8_9PEZI|nr:hypothetical protein QBC35DRAFT_495365 [Podospora australis]